MLMQTANREDLAFLRGDGAAGTPTGFRNAIASAHISASASGTTLTTMLSDVQDLMTDLALANIPMERPAFFLSPRSLISLLFARDASGDGLLLRQEIASGSLFGIPLFTTTQIPVNLGGGAESEMYLVDMSQVIIGDSLAPVVEFFDNGTYNNNAGVLTSGISTDSTVIRLKQEHDIIMLHPEAGAVKTAVDF
jgi:HK97 family phage major capsid protein